jgi:hypothetical protein
MYGSVVMLSISKWTTSKNIDEFLYQIKQNTKNIYMAVSIDLLLELVSKELNHLAAILHVYAGGLNFMK